MDTLSVKEGFKYHPKCSRTAIKALLFADDLLIFCHRDIKSVGLIKQQLEKFFEASSLIANLDKSALYTAGMDDVLQSELSVLLGMPVGSLPFRYLGCYYHIKR